MTDDVIPCPTCWLLADLQPATIGDAMRRSICARGHENSLAPSIVNYLKTMLGPAFGDSA